MKYDLIALVPEMKSIQHMLEGIELPEVEGVENDCSD